MAQSKSERCAQESLGESLSVLLQEAGEEVRARRDPEHLYTAATVGALGAVAWGVAAIGAVPAINPMPWYSHPALVGAIGSLILSVAVIFKIVREHKSYVAARNEQIRLADAFAKASGLDTKILPQGLRASSVGRGHLSSIAIVAAACIASVGFCISIWLRVRH